MPDYWDTWFNQPRTKDEILEQLSKLLVRLGQCRRGDHEADTVMKQIRELSNRLKERQ